MSLFNGPSGGVQSERACKRDIESEIRHRRTTLKQTQDFLDACMKYADAQSLYNLSSDKFNFAELVGALQLNVAAANREIAGLIREQEILAAQAQQ